MNKLKKTLMGIRFMGLPNALRTARSSLQRDRLEQRHPQAAPGPLRQPGPLLSAEPLPQGAYFTFDEGFDLEIQFLAPHIVRLTWTPGALPVPYSLANPDGSLAPAAPPSNPTPPADELNRGPSPAAALLTLAMRTEGGGAQTLASAALRLTLLPNGTLRLATPSGHPLRTEHPPSRRATSWHHSASFPFPSACFGLGERTAPLNLLPGAYRLWNTDPGGSYGPGADPLYLNIPLYYTRTPAGGCLVFYENSHEATFTFTRSETSATFRDGALRYYLITGDPAEALAAYTALTGRPPLPPRWALGFHQSRWGYKTEDEIRAIAAGFRERGLPLHAIHLDIDYMDGYRVFSVDPARFPGLPHLSADLAAQGIHLVTILDPGVKIDPAYDVYTSGLGENAFCTLPSGEPARALVWPGWCVFPDFTRPATRFWWGEFYPRLLDAGVAGIWHDMNEPAAFQAWGDLTLPRPTRHDFDGRGGAHGEAHNLYGLLMARAGFEALRRHRPDRRPWLLTRSGWAGLQRYAWSWTGDSESTWPALKMTIATALNLGFSGIPYTGPDIGGFSGSPDAELFTRWFQMAAFMPFFRNHAARGTPAREPWSFGEPTLSICRDFLKLRERLLPYFYTLAWQATQTGAPLVRPLFWGEPGNAELWEVDDAFLLGDALLVAPVLQPQATSRSIHLPAGAWYNFWDDSVMEAAPVVESRLTLERIPVLVRAGTVLPTREGRAETLHVYAPLRGSAESFWFADEGEGYGETRQDRFRVTREGSTLRVEWETEGEYPLPEEVVVRLHGFEARAAWADGEPVGLSGSSIQTKPFRELRFEEEG